MKRIPTHYKHVRKLCQNCRQHRAKFRWYRQVFIYAEHHDLCPQCWRALCNRFQSAVLRRACRGALLLAEAA